MPGPYDIRSALVGDAEIETLLTGEERLAAILAFEQALAEAEADAGLVPPSAVPAIRSAIRTSTPDHTILAAGVARDGTEVPALIERLRAAMPRQLAKYVHFGATSQDAIDTALVLQLTRVLPIFAGRLDALQSALGDLSDLRGTEPLIAHTRMQAALPFTAADKLNTWLRPLAAHRASLAALLPQLLVVQLGGPIGNRSTFEGKGDAVASGIAARLGLGAAEPWHSDRSRVAVLGSWLALVSGSLGKVGADISLMTQTEVGAVRLQGAGSSSAMAHKANPVRAEALVALARHNAGLVGTLHQALIHEGERSGAAWTLEWLVLPQMLVTTGASLKLAGELVEQLEFSAPATR